jgi:hypothetical protein
MSELLLDYKLIGASVSNPDGSFPIVFTDVTVVAGPGATPIGRFDQALDLGAAGKGAVSLSGLKVDSSRFTLRVTFQAKGPIGARQNLVESDWLPFSLYLVPGNVAGEIVLVANVAPKAHGWNGPTTRFLSIPLKLGIWYSADLVYDNDTAGLFIDGEIVSVHAFPKGYIELMPGSRMYVGTWVDGARNHFGGLIAAIQWYADIPAELESRLDERRSQAEWFTTYKYEAIKPKLNFGDPQAAPTHDATTGAYLQPYDGGVIMYHDGVGTAFEMHGDIYTFYKSWSAKASLGYLVSDEGNTTHPDGRKNIFSQGGIYWSQATGAKPVTGQMYLDYEHMGESSIIGFPTMLQAAISGGIEQEFQGGRMYFKSGATNAHEINGAILAKFLATGGVNTWGYPITNETDLIKNGAPIGKFSEFEACTIYWNGGTGAFEVHGDIRRKYKDMAGPIGDLGFPLSDEGPIPGVGGTGRYNCFQNGSLLWYGSFDSIIVARPFHLFLGRVDTKESEGFLMGQNDLYMNVTLKVGASLVYNRKQPPSGDFGGHNIVDVDLNIPYQVVPNSPDKVVVFGLDIWDSDDGAPFGGGDDHLGTYTHELTMANGWGMRENQGVYNTGSFSKINNISWSVKPDVNYATLSETQKFWGVVNRSSDRLTYQQYASAFRDVDSDPEWWDLTDWLEKAFYELVIKGLAKGGNCFGMSLESIYSRKNMSQFGLPIDRFTNWDTVVNEFNIKHCYQVGADPIWWFVGEFLSGHTHNPKSVFQDTFQEFSRGNHPVVCIAQNYDFSGAPHCILPVAWDSTGKPWRMTICDPNVPLTTKVLTINPDDNTFEYISSADRVYRGGAWSGGRFHYMPFCKVNTRPRTPIWDAIALILAGTVLILGEDAETTSITDMNGNDLDGLGQRATDQLKSLGHLDNYFVPAKGWGAGFPIAIPANTQFLLPERTKGTVPGEVLLRKKPVPRFTAVAKSMDASATAHLALGAIMTTAPGKTLATELRNQPTVLRSIQDRSAHFVANDPAVMAKLSGPVQDLVRQIAAVTFSDFKHNIRGLRNGSFAYAAKHILSEFRIQSDIQLGEGHALQVNDLGTSKSVVSLSSGRSKLTTVQIASKLGVERDELKLTIEGVPVESGKELVLNIKPGLGGLELLASNQPSTATVTFEATVDGKNTIRKFGMPVAGGMRLKTSQLLSDTSINISRIERLFGPVTATTKIRITP